MARLAISAVRHATGDRPHVRRQRCPGIPAVDGPDARQAEPYVVAGSERYVVDVPGVSVVDNEQVAEFHGVDALRITSQPPVTGWLTPGKRRARAVAPAASNLLTRRGRCHGQAASTRRGLSRQQSFLSARQLGSAACALANSMRHGMAADTGLERWRVVILFWRFGWWVRLRLSWQCRRWVSL